MVCNATLAAVSGSRAVQARYVCGSLKVRRTYAFGTTGGARMVDGGGGTGGGTWGPSQLSPCKRE